MINDDCAAADCEREILALQVWYKDHCGLLGSGWCGRCCWGRHGHDGLESGQPFTFHKIISGQLDAVPMLMEVINQRLFVGKVVSPHVDHGDP